MPLVSRADVGAAAYDRMLRDGIVVPVAPQHARPLDIPEGRRDRAEVLAAAVPAHTVVSAGAGLWFRFGGAWPGTVDVVGRRGLHRHKPGTRPAGILVAFHSGAAAQEPSDAVAGVRFAGAARCAADALRWGELKTAVPRVFTLVARGEVDGTEVGRIVASGDPRGAGAARQASAWAAISGALRR